MDVGWRMSAPIVTSSPDQDLNQSYPRDFFRLSALLTPKRPHKTILYVSLQCSKISYTIATLSSKITYAFVSAAPPADLAVLLTSYLVGRQVPILVLS